MNIKQIMFFSKVKFEGILYIESCSKVITMWINLSVWLLHFVKLVFDLISNRGG